MPGRGPDPVRSAFLRRRRTFLCAAGVVLVLALCPLPAEAQGGPQIRGRVTGPGGAPVAGARVQVSNAAGRVAEARTDRAGWYSVRVPAQGEGYVVSVEAATLAPATRVLTRAGPTGDYDLDVPLELRPVRLEALDVVVRRLTVAGATRSSPGTEEQSRLGIELRNEPLDAGGVNEIASRQVGVAQSPGAGLSMAGQSPDQTRVTLDGMAGEQAVVPREAIRAVNVMANTFDVGRGQFTGGQVDVRTLQASNAWGATARTDLDHRRFRLGDAPLLPGRGASRLGVDAGGGGALVRDRLFALAAATATWSAPAGVPLDELGPGALRRLGLERDSVLRFQAITAPFRDGLAASSLRGSSLASGLVRLDAVLSPRHSLMVRVNGQRSRSSQDAFPQAAPGTSSARAGSVLGGLARLSSGGRRVANELRVATSASSSTVTPADHSPAGAVEVSSAVDAAERPALLWFAGSPASEPNVSQRTAELGDELVVVTADGRHRFRSGLEATFRRYRAEPGESNGTFLFRSLRDLEENRVTLFTRSFDLQPREADERRWTIFADDRWRTATFQVSYGLRAERWSVAGGRAPDAQILSRFEPLTAVVPSSWQVSPRIGFAFAARMPWNRPGGAKTEFQGGVGRFVGALGLSELAAALAENGAPETAPVVCIGSAAPVPDWAAYREDPSSAPTACREGSSSGSERLPSATLFAPGFSPPQAARASLGARGVAPGRLVWRINAAFVRGSHQPLAFDRNLRTTPAFTNTAEGGRPVYSPPGEIDPGTGLLPLAASRRFPELGHVRALTAEGRSRTLQLSLSASKLTTRITALAGYTWTDAVDDVGPLVAVGGNGGSVGSDPNRAESAASPYTPRHLLFASAEWRRSSHLTFTLFARASSGFLFTPMVNGDANGDGTTNDRAFVFEPAPGESGVHTDMARLLDGASAPLRGCLARQVGRVAAANSCSTAPFASADLRVAVQLGPRMPRSPNRRMTLWLVARNLPSGLDYLLHGPEHLRGWGQPMSVDNTLLMVRGFDPATRTFRYEVNPGFGRPPASGLLRPSVFAVGIQARIAIGADRVDAAFQESIDAGSNRRRTLTPEALAAHFAGQLPDLSAEVLRQNAPSRLYLTPAQAAALQQRSDSVAPLVARLLTELTRAAQSAPGAVVGIPDGPLNALVREAVALRRADADAVRTILSLDQWRQLPAALRATESPFLPYPAERITSPPEY